MKKTFQQLNLSNAFLEEYGTIPEHIRKAVMVQEDLTVLKRWLKLAVRAGSMEQFEKEM